MNLKESVIKQIVKSILNEEDESVTGDQAAASLARGDVALEKSKRILSSLGVSSPVLDDIFSVPQLEVEAFQFDFTVEDVKDDPRELTTPKEEDYSGLARVVKFDGNLILEFKPNGEKNTFTIEFSKNDVYTNLPGTKKNIPALVIDKKYNVLMGDGFIVDKKGEEDDGEQEGGEQEGGEQEGGEGKVKKNKQQLYNDLTSFFQFIVNNKKKLNIKSNLSLENKNEYFLDQATDLILEEEPPIEKTEEKNKSLITRIIITNIVLGKKAESKKKSDIQITFGSGGIFTVKQMVKNKFYPVTGKITANVPGNLEKEIKNLFNANQKYEIRKSENEDKGGKQSIVIKLPGKEEFIMVKPKSDEYVDWLSKKPIPIIIGKKALGYETDSFEGEIQLQASK